MYIILSGETSHELQAEVNKFVEENYSKYELIGGPYSDGKFHYQAVQTYEYSILNG